MFITSTVRGWTPIFQRAEMRDALTASLLDDHRFYGAPCHAFVVMQHHFHTVSIMPPGKSCAWFANRLKSDAAKRILPLLSEREKQALEEAPEDGGRTMWNKSFRGVPITSEQIGLVKMNYVHLNPVRAGLCEHPLEYRWSSAHLREASLYDYERGLDIDAALRFFGEAPSLPRSSEPPPVGG